MEIKSGYIAPDGTFFETKAAVNDYLRRPKVLEALLKLTSGQEELANWLLDNQETVIDSFETGQITRVSKSEKSKLVKALEAIAEDGNSKFQFVIDNREAIANSFRWPSVKRMTDEEKAAAARASLVEAAGSEEVADWVLAAKVGVLEAYNAGKTPPNPKGADALKDFRRKKTREALEAAKAAGDEEAIAKAQAAYDKAHA